jgi:hypothetical protein
VPQLGRLGGAGDLQREAIPLRVGDGVDAVVPLLEGDVAPVRAQERTVVAGE